MGSYISRDYIALEAMKEHLSKSVFVKRTIFNRIACALGFGIPKISICYRADIVAQFAYKIADAMIAEREKLHEEQTEQDE